MDTIYNFNKMLIQRDLDPHLIASNTITALQCLASTNYPYVFPPALQMDYDPSENTEKKESGNPYLKEEALDGRSHFTMGMYQYEFTTDPNRFTIVPTISKLIIYPARICKVLEMEFGFDEGFGWELFALFFVHTLTHEYNHHVSNVLSYHDFIKKMMGAPDDKVKEKLYKEYVELIKTRDADINEESSIEYATLRIFPTVVEMVFGDSMTNILTNKFMDYMVISNCISLAPLRKLMKVEGTTEELLGTVDALVDDLIHMKNSYSPIRIILHPNIDANIDWIRNEDEAESSKE